MSAAKPKPAETLPFWNAKSLSEMTDSEWESLCDGCGRCCLNKLLDEDTNETAFTDVGCDLLDDETCRCKDYKNRQARVPDCVRLTWSNVQPAVLAAADLRLSPRRQRAGSLLVASARFRLSGDGARRPASRCAAASPRARPTCRTIQSA